MIDVGGDLRCPGGALRLLIWNDYPLLLLLIVVVGRYVDC